MGGRIVLIDSYLVDQIHLKIKSKIFIMCLLQGIKKDLVCQVSAIFYLWIISVTVIAYHTINMWKLQCWHLWLFRKVVQLCKNNVGSFCKTLQFYKVTLKWPLNYDGSARWATPSFIFWLLFFMNSYLALSSQVFVDQLTSKDMEFIGDLIFPSIDKEIVIKMVEFSNRVCFSLFLYFVGFC